MVDMTDWYDDFIREEKVDEEIIELRDIVEEEKISLDEDDIIVLKDIVEADNAALDLDSIKKEDVGSGQDLEQEGDISVKEGLELEADGAEEEIPFEPYVAKQPDPELTVTREQLEAALEKVIEKKFADRIEGILFESMEKVIKNEIHEIKERLKKDLNQMEIV